MSVSKRKDGRYVRTVVIGIKDGKSVKKYLYGKTLREVDKKYRDFMAMKEKGIVQDTSQITIEELSQRWLEYEKKPFVRPQSYDNLVSAVKVLNGYFGYFRVQQLRYADVLSVQHRLISEGKESTYNRCLYLLRSILQYAIREDITFRDVTSGAKPLKVAKTSQKRALTDAEITRLFSAELTLEQKAIIYTLYYTGVRRGELIALQKGDVDFDNHLITINKTTIDYKKGRKLVQQMPKTDSSIRKVLMPPHLEQILREYMDSTQSDLVFPNNRGTVMMAISFRKRWDKISEAIFGEGNVPEGWTPHMFRHNYATMLYQSNTPIKISQALLGHANIRTTLNVYTHLNVEEYDATDLMAFIDRAETKRGQKEVKPS